MRRGVLLLLTLAVVIGVALVAWRFWPVEAPPVLAEGGVPVEVPSGQSVAYLDTIQNVPGEGLVYRFRFLAPGISREGGSVSEEVAQADMEWLCTNFALARIPEIGPQPSQIIISFSDRPVAFGEPAPDATQFFEGYRIEDERCVWELF